MNIDEVSLRDKAFILFCSRPPFIFVNLLSYSVQCRPKCTLAYVVIKYEKTEDKLHQHHTVVYMLFIILIIVISG